MVDTIAIIPAKGRSTRVPNKNLRNFHQGQSLLDVKIEQCKAAKTFDAIYVSSDSEEARHAAQRHGVEFLLRDDRFCLDETPWNEVLAGILHQLPHNKDAWISLCPPTTPIFNGYGKAMETLREQSQYDSLMAVTRMQHYFLGPDMLPLNFQFGVWFSSSQNLRPIYQMNCALWIAKKGTMLTNRFQIGDHPYFMEISAIEGTDIDTLEEFELAQLIYSKRHGAPQK